MTVIPVLDLRFRSDPSVLRMVRDKVKEATERVGCNDACIADIVMAVNEACMNIMQHAYKGDCSGEIVLEILNNGRELEVCLKDFATPVDTGRIEPRKLDDLRPGGLGTYFIRKAMDDCVYGHLDGACGNILRMKKKIE